jgi:hypothetical protein
MKSTRDSDAGAVIDRLRIFEVRGQAVVLDSDLAAIYGVPTKVLNQAIRRNAARFPHDFLHRLNAEEWTVLRSQFVTLKPAVRKVGGSKMPNWHLKDRTRPTRKYPPWAFTEHGAIMAATLLNRTRAVANPVSFNPDQIETNSPFLRSKNCSSVAPLPHALFTARPYYLLRLQKVRHAARKTTGFYREVSDHARRRVARHLRQASPTAAATARTAKTPNRISPAPRMTFIWHGSCPP